MKRALINFIILITIVITTSFSTLAQGWTPVGISGFSAAATGQTSIVIDKNNTPYVVYQDATVNYGPTVMKYNGSSWVNVGIPGFSGGPVAEFSNVAIALDTGGTPYVVYGDGTATTAVYPASVMKYSDTSWVYVGSPDFTLPQAVATCIAIDRKGTPYVFYSDGTGGGFKAAVMKYNDTAWVNVGPVGFSSGQVNYCSIAIDSSGTPYVAYSGCGTTCGAIVMKYNGTAWVYVGSPAFSAGEAWYTSIAIDAGGTPYVVYMDMANSGKATVMKYNGSNWVTVGSAGFSAGQVATTTIAIDHSGTPYVVYEEAPPSANGPATVMKFNGSNWITVGSVGFSGGEAQYTSIAIDTGGIPYVVYEDSINNWKATVMKADSTTTVKNITNHATSSLTIFPNPNHNSFTLKISTYTKEPATITITNILGEKLKQLTTNTNTDTNIELNAPPGMYFVSATTTEGNQTAKLEIW